ncbi:hypothetical protein JHK87_049696 [Glycine soja]|nr:hypothetical protein JHK87_049696 [Glycine soja]
MVVLEGLRWRLGDGNKIHVWFDPWLRGGTKKLTKPIVNSFDPNLLLNDLIDRDSDNKNPMSSNMVHKANAFLSEKRQAQEEGLSKERSTTRQAQDDKWQPPSTSLIMCNLDATFFNVEGEFGAGMCIRDDLGQFLLVATKLYPIFPLMNKGEALVL